MSDIADENSTDMAEDGEIAEEESLPSIQDIQEMFATIQSFFQTQRGTGHNRRQRAAARRGWYQQGRRQNVVQGRGGSGHAEGNIAPGRGGWGRGQSRGMDNVPERGGQGSGNGTVQGRGRRYRVRGNGGRASSRRGYGGQANRGRGNGGRGNARGIIQQRGAQGSRGWGRGRGGGRGQSYRERHQGDGRQRSASFSFYL